MKCPSGHASKVGVQALGVLSVPSWWSSSRIAMPANISVKACFLDVRYFHEQRVEQQNCPVVDGRVPDIPATRPIQLHELGLNDQKLNGGGDHCLCSCTFCSATHAAS